MKTPQLALVLSLAATSASAASPFRVGAPLPRVTLPSIEDGAARSLSDFRGEKLMLHVWASW